MKSSLHDLPEWPPLPDYPDYESLKSLAKELKRRVTSLLALSSNNDPFYCGMPAQRDKARWFAALWKKFGYTRGVHLRRMHYQIVSQDPPIKMVNGEPYENTEKCWDELGKASQAARYLDMVDPENFVDRRNGSPVDNIDYDTKLEAPLDITGKHSLETDLLFKLPDFPNLPSYLFLPGSPQRYHLELWCEKSTQDDILRPLAQDYRAALQYGLGELSITLAIEALRRFERSHKPVRIFYISDFDPTGWNMPRSMSSKLQYYNLKLGLNLDIKLFPIILTPEQVKAYNLPRTPIKDSDKRKSKFEERFGIGATELDALEALYPGELRSILEEELDRYYDVNLSYALDRFESRVDRSLDAKAEQVYVEFVADISEARNEWLAIQREFKQRIDEQIEKSKPVWQAIVNRLEQEKPDISTEDVPEADYAEERDGALLDSSRDYLTQNDIYQTHKGNESDEE
ncbi:MAG: hypothetical protein ACJ8DI_25745 [Ktedonobacteraceae bacterium]